MALTEHFPLTRTSPGHFSHASPLVQARGVSLRYGRRRVLDSVDLVVRPGEIVTLVGLNGAGKSTLIRVLLGIVRPDAGEVVRMPGLRVGYSPQQVHRDPVLPMTVRRFLTLGAPAPRERLEALLDEVGAGAILAHPMAEICGGELHRVLLARALLREPGLLVLDEPLAGVDVTGQSELYGLIAGIRDRHGCGVLLVSHDLHLVMAATDTVVCLNRHVCCTVPLSRPAARDVGVAAGNAVHEPHRLEEGERSIDLRGRRPAALPVESREDVVGSGRPVLGEEQLEHLAPVLGETLPAAPAGLLGTGQTLLDAGIVVMPRRGKK